MSDYSTLYYTHKDNEALRRELWDGILSLCEDKDMCNAKIQELYVTYKRYNFYFFCFDNFLYYLKPYLTPQNDNYIQSLDTQDLAMLFLDSLIALEYANKAEKIGYTFDDVKLKSDFEKIKPLITNECKLRTPTHKNTIYDTLYYRLINKFKLQKDDVGDMLNIIFGMAKKPKQLKTNKRDLLQLIEHYQDLKEWVSMSEKFKELPHSEQRQELNEYDLDIKTLQKRLKT